MLKEYTQSITCYSCGNTHVPEDRKEDAYGNSYCAICGSTTYDKNDNMIVHHFWSVAVYENNQAYGGPEEGGWWYQEGTITDYNKVKIFNSYKKACKYYNKLTKEGYYAIGYNSKYPDDYFPVIKPRYY